MKPSRRNLIILTAVSSVAVLLCDCGQKPDPLAARVAKLEADNLRLSERIADVAKGLDATIDLFAKKIMVWLRA